ncbi:TPA: polymerase [Streptococcus suis]|nr:polymerase [Streptococcus suis]
MKLKINNLFFVCLSFIGIILGSSQAIINFGLANIIQYLSYFVLIMCIIDKLLKIDKRSVLRIFYYFLLITFLFTIGIFQQNLPLTTKMYLAFSMIIISILSVMPINLINKVEDFRKISNYLLFGLLLSTFLGIILNVPLFTIAVEGVGVGYGFNGGLTHKNFYAITILLSFMLRYISYKYGQEKRGDILVLSFELMLIIISNTRSVYLIFLVFLLIVHFEFYFNIKNNQQKLLNIIIIIVGVISSYYIFNFLVISSGSYTHRVNGVINFFNYYRSDWFHLTFGAADLAFGDMTRDYGYNIRSVTGWNGTVEMPLLSVMIKNGFIGLVGYSIVLVKFILNVRNIKNKEVKVIGLSILIPLLLSAIVENYIVNVDFVFMPVCFCILNSINQIELYYKKELIK